jgi:putative transposase
MEYKTYTHNPPHLFLDRSPYFITGGTHKKQAFWFDDDRKKILLDAIKDWFSKYKWDIEAWIIFENHYHLIGWSFKGENLSSVIRKTHGRSATLLNKLDGCQNRQVWWNYWDRCIRSEKDFLAYLYYILWNPIKHRLVSHPEQYKWSSYNQTMKKYESMDIEKGKALLQKLGDDCFDDF